ncbi:kinase-like protein, partial [Martensiomyces pterosporus]
MDSYLSKLRGLASSAANAVQSKIGRDYDVNLSGTPLGEAGLWSLFKATRRSSGQLVTVWVFEKRYFEQGINRQLFTTREQNLVLELLKGEASQLTRLRHPSVLQVVEPLEETRGSLMFVTEQVIASLDDLVNPDNRYRPRSGSDWASSGRMVDGEEFELDDLEIQKGLLQVSKGLQFLHNDAKIVHGNLVPASILINAKGDWKLGGFGFAKHLNYSSTHHADGTSDAAKINFEHDYQLPSHTQQNLDFLAPEFVLEGTCSSASDLFSLGCLAFAVHSDGQSPMDCRNDIGAYRREIARLAPDKLSKLPEYLAPVVGSLLVANPAQRLTLSQFQTSKYFDNVLVATIRYLDAIVEQPQDQKIAFMRGLPRVLPKFPDRVMRRKVLPALIDQTNDHALLPFTLPNVFFVVEKLTPKEFVDLALPGLKPVFSILDPPQASIVLLDNLGLLQKKAPTSVFRVDVMPLLYTALTSTVAQVQDKALQAVPTIAETIDYADLKDQLFPRVQQLYSKASVLSLKIRALICLHGMLKSLDKGTIVEKLMPLLKRTKTREPGVMMTMLVMYEEIGLKYVDKEVVAKEILPVLWAQSIDSQLKLDQFKRFMQTVSKLADKVEKEQTKHLDEVRKIEDQTARV